MDKMLMYELNCQLPLGGFYEEELIKSIELIDKMQVKVGLQDQITFKINYVYFRYWPELYYWVAK